MRHERIGLHKITRPANPHRLTFDDQKQYELEQSIRRLGLINPITVRENGETFELIAGDRRYQAHLHLNLTHIDCSVREPGDPDHDEAVQFAENFERADLSPMEEAIAIERALQQPSMNLEEVARTVNRSKDWVHNRLELLDIPDELKSHVHAKRLGIAAALELKNVTDDDHRAYLLRYALDAGATVASIREWVRTWEITHAAADGSQAPRPAMPLDGQPITIQMPCYVCHVALPHDQLRILRICPDCTHALAGAGLTHQQAEPPTGPDPPRAEPHRDQHSA
jgi:ParB family chromosome partitioning protein